jgi:hypothetical protein
VLGERPLNILKIFLCAFDLNSKKCKKAASRGNWTEIDCFFANSRLKMLLKAIGQPLSIPEKVQESCREMPKGSWIASGPF